MAHLREYHDVLLPPMKGYDWVMSKVFYPCATRAKPLPCTFWIWSLQLTSNVNYMKNQFHNAEKNLGSQSLVYIGEVCWQKCW